MQQITYITVDVGRLDSLPPIIPAKQGDTGRYVQAAINDKGVPFNLGSAVAVARIRKPDGTACYYDDGISISGNIITFPLIAQSLAAAGRARGEISLYTSAADRITTFDFWLDIEKNAVADAEIVSTDYFSALTRTAAQILSSNTIVKPKGYYATLTALQSAVPNPAIGDIYGVGTSLPYNYYSWDGSAWINNGQLQGAPGATFTPIVYSDGVLAWTNDAGLDNPEPVNITGPQGLPGTGLEILGYYATLEALMTDVPAPATGDTYGIGVSAPYDIYVWDGVGQRWVNNGQLQGVPGQDGAPGEDGAPGPQGPAGPNQITPSTATSLTGILLGDGGNVSSAAILPVSTGGTGASNAIDAVDMLAAEHRLNRILNWDFLNPVNQRKKTSWAGTGYMIDCWKINGTAGSAAIGADGLTLTAGASATTFVQWLEDDFTGQELTLSIMLDGVLYTASGTGGKDSIGDRIRINPMTGLTFDFAFDSSKKIYRAFFTVSAGMSFTISKVKLEIGGKSSLSANSKAAVVDEIFKAKRYFHLYDSAEARPATAYESWPIMRNINLTQGTVDIDGVTYYYNSAEL